jgi:hypothetical protein
MEEINAYGLFVRKLSRNTKTMGAYIEMEV